MTTNELLVRRIGARCIDAFTVLFLTFACVATLLVLVMDRLTQAFDRGPWGSTLGVLLLYALLGGCYETVFVARSGQTPGKDLMNIRVVDVATAEPPAWRAAIKRSMCMAVARLVPGVVVGTLAPLLFGLSVPVGASGRGVHDYFCGTRVEFFDADACAGADSTELTPVPVAAIYGAGSWARVVERWMPGRAERDEGLESAAR